MVYKRRSYHSLKTKLFYIIFFTFFIFVLGFVFTSNIIVMGGFNVIENENMHQHLKRVEDAFNLQLETLETKIADWSMWDDAYLYMKNSNTAFETSNLVPSPLLSMKLDLFIFLKNNGEIHWGKLFDLENNKVLNIHKDIKAFIQQNTILFITKEFKNLNGIIDFPVIGPSFVSVQPILNSNGEGPSHGSMIAVRSINKNMLSRIIQLTRLNIEILEVNKVSLNNKLNHAVLKLGSLNHAVITESEDQVAGIKYLYDSFNKPILYVYFSKSREIYAQGKKALWTYSVSIVFIFIIMGIIFWKFLSQFVISRIYNLNFEISSLMSSGKRDLRILEKGNDEITALASATNKFLNEIEVFEKKIELERAKSFHTAKLASLGEMSAGIAHEINNPLAIIAGYLPLLENLKEDPVKFINKINIIQKAVFRIEKIVKGLKKFSRSSEGTVHKVENLEAIIQESLVIVDAKLKKNSVDLKLECEPHLEIFCDSVEIEQVFVNLINNSIDAIQTKNEKWIVIKAFSLKDKIILRIIDSGDGIAEEIEKKLFQPFFTTKEVGEGTGLGLSISKGILEQHKSKIELNHTFQNTCFEIIFPKPQVDVSSNKLSA